MQQAGIDGALARNLTALASTAAGAAVGGVAGATTALNEVANNFLKHPEAAAFKRRLDGCEAQKGGCPEDQRKAILGTYLDLSGKNIQELQTCTLQADAACLNRIQTEIARSAELPASLVGNEATVFIGKQANAQDDVARAQIYVKDIAKARQTICGSLPTAACDQKLMVAKGDATAKAAGLVLAALGGGVVPEGVALVNAGANLVLRTGLLVAVEAKTLATMGPVLYCAQLGSGGGCAAIVDAAMQIASGVVSPISVVPVVAGAKAAQVVEGEVIGTVRVAQGAGSGVASVKLVASNSLGTTFNGITGPGPLGQNVANTFRSGTYTELTTTESTTLYRVWGGKSSEIGPLLDKGRAIRTCAVNLG
ncbi:hypothetical protein IMCC9480_2256 [Oxalobacteraceae bacterium IMCC9480]|nr:hypothetical protein IMCC9480_2256 [Oxalobacteraceae bacterium IMCC9480]